jgi:enamine deaminase RidA (YjgF/YER057c/UK114 family)
MKRHDMSRNLLHMILTTGHNLRNRNQINKAWDAWAVPGHTPVRATVEAKLASPEYGVEIMIEAAVR